MTDDELIAWLENSLQFRSDIHPIDSDRLIALARIGASVMPRPIEEAPEDGTKILLMGNGPGFWATEGAWVGHASEWRDATSFTFKLVEPHSWLPLSALQVKPRPPIPSRRW